MQLNSTISVSQQSHAPERFWKTQRMQWKKTGAATLILQKTQIS